MNKRAGKISNVCVYHIRRRRSMWLNMLWFG